MDAKKGVEIAQKVNEEGVEGAAKEAAKEGAKKVAKEGLKNAANAAWPYIWPVLLVIAIVVLLMLLLQAITAVYIAAQVAAQQDGDGGTCVAEFSGLDMDNLPQLDSGDAQASGVETAATAWTYLRQAGWSEEATAAVLANAWKESTFNFGTRDTSATYYNQGEMPGCIGLWQWCNAEDKQLLNEKDGGWNNLANQLDFFTEVGSVVEGEEWFYGPKGKGAKQSYNYYFDPAQPADAVWFESLEDFKTTTDVDLATTVFLAQWEHPSGSTASGFAERERRIARAHILLEAFGGQEGELSEGCKDLTLSCSGDVAAMQAFVEEKIENPAVLYPSGGEPRTGPTRYDCSGFVTGAYIAMGHPLAGGTAGTATMWSTFPSIYQEVTDGNYQYGDISVSRGGGQGHTALYVGDGKWAEFYSSGEPGRYIDLASLRRYDSASGGLKVFRVFGSEAGQCGGSQ